MKTFDLPPGVVKAVAGIVQSVESEPYATALVVAEQAVLDKYSAVNGKTQRHLIEAIQESLVNKRAGAVTLIRRYELPMSERTFRRARRYYCWVVAKELGMVKE